MKVIEQSIMVNITIEEQPDYMEVRQGEDVILIEPHALPQVINVLTESLPTDCWDEAEKECSKLTPDHPYGAYDVSTIIDYIKQHYHLIKKDKYYGEENGIATDNG